MPATSKTDWEFMELIDGNAIAESILAQTAAEVAQISGRKPTVVFIRVGEDPASVSYVAKKQKVAAQVGMQSQLELFPESITQAELLGKISALNADPQVDGILVQSPLPKHMGETAVFNHVSPDKDVDGFNTLNVGKLVQEDPSGFVACTPAGIVELIRRANVETDGRHVVVVGRSLIVGKPVGLLLLQKGLPGNATVTFCHSRTRDLPSVTRNADILIAAIGRPRFITADMVKDGATVIDVGINRVPDATKKSGYRIVGDVDFDAVAPRAARITPVPGGVGPMTVALLMRNTLKAWKKHHA
ncbi:MAG TPA: bifunctional methylenetetrahydrofolate dehydrogenase/methenyltetrahydrofolate cyclohydrolase FolD [Opitutales bacterium]|jgi:methylenetetrahydrofolate dehydrogenase (NADP+)/methenyltetrahydrofolate cyclohydrolase|nr:bifunctional methylenetetrahydrofolate dehydrogenase/methenyltetrahydrofolate cyclohydrolase FolD [Opitutales bacterium]